MKSHDKNFYLDSLKQLKEILQMKGDLNEEPFKSLKSRLDNTINKFSAPSISQTQITDIIKEYNKLGQEITTLTVGKNQKEVGEKSPTILSSNVNTLYQPSPSTTARVHEVNETRNAILKLLKELVSEHDKYWGQYARIGLPTGIKDLKKFFDKNELPESMPLGKSQAIWSSMKQLLDERESKDPKMQDFYQLLKDPTKKMSDIKQGLEKVRDEITQFESRPKRSR